MTAKPDTHLPVEIDSRPVGALAVPESAGLLLTKINEEEALWDDLDDLDMVPNAESTGVPFVKTDGNIDGGLYMDGQLVDHVAGLLDGGHGLDRQHRPEDLLTQHRRPGWQVGGQRRPTEPAVALGRIG